MKEEYRLTVKRGNRTVHINPSSLREDDTYISGDPRLLHYARATRGLTRIPIETASGARREGLVLVERPHCVQGIRCRRRQWVAGDMVRPDDTVISGEEYIRPYRYGRKGGRCRNPQSGIIALMRKLASGSP